MSDTAAYQRQMRRRQAERMDALRAERDETGWRPGPPITYSLMCDRCGFGWSVDSPEAFTALTEKHRAECRGTDAA